MTARRDIEDITNRIRERSRPTREPYLALVDEAAGKTAHRTALSCGNLAHGMAACGLHDKEALAGERIPNLGIVTSYNDMLSAHQPFETFPALIKQAAHEAGGVAQVAGGVPAMCDGVTQGQPGMELSLFSRDVIAMAAAVGLSHNMFDAAVYLGVCDKIVPGLAIAALTFGHLPAIFIPAGPMTSGLSNDEKARVRQLYAEGKVGRDALLEAEAKSYHGPGTCTFYGTANSNQMLMEMMGLHMPGASFVNPGTPLRDALTREAARRALAITALGNEFTPVGRMIDERSFVNGIVGLNATGGSTNHTIHLIAMAAAAGIRITWQDISDISDRVPLLARVYPNGLADVNHFHAAGGLGFLIRELLDAGLLHEDVRTVNGEGLRPYAVEAKLSEDGGVMREPAPAASGDEKVLAPYAKAFQPTGGIRVLSGNLGHAIIKVSAVKPEKRIVEASGDHLRRAGGTAGRLQGGQARSRFRRDHPLPGAEGQRHARTAQAHPGAGHPPGPRLPHRTGHRRAHVGRVGQGAGGHPRHAGGARRRRHRQAARRRPGKARRRCRHAGGSGAGGGTGRPGAGRTRPFRQFPRHGPRIVCRLPAARLPRRRGREQLRHRRVGPPCAGHPSPLRGGWTIAAGDWTGGVTSAALDLNFLTRSTSRFREARAAP